MEGKKHKYSKRKLVKDSLSTKDELKEENNNNCIHLLNSDPSKLDHQRMATLFSSQIGSGLLPLEFPMFEVPKITMQ